MPADLRTVTGERLVVLLTDGEESCGGDPAAAIEQLKKGGAVRVNIVGFAIDDKRLAASFRHRSDLGNGTYFDAKDAAGLGSALTQAMQPGSDVLDAEGKIVGGGVSGGDPVAVMPGNYSVRLKGAPKGSDSRSQAVTVRPKEVAAVKF